MRRTGSNACSGRSAARNADTMCSARSRDIPSASIFSLREKETMRRLTHLAPRVVGLPRLAVGPVQELLSRDVDHRAADRRVERVRVEGDEDGAVLMAAVLPHVLVDRVGEVPPEVNADGRVLDRVRRRRQHARGPRARDGLRARRRRTARRARPSARRAPSSSRGPAARRGTRCRRRTPPPRVRRRARPCRARRAPRRARASHPTRSALRTLFAELRRFEPRLLLLDPLGVVRADGTRGRGPRRGSEPGNRPAWRARRRSPLRAAISAAFALTSSACSRPVKRTTTAE